MCPALRAGPQYFGISPIGPKHRFLQFRVTHTYGAPKTYLNAVFLFAARLAPPGSDPLPPALLPSPPEATQQGQGPLHETAAFEASPEIPAPRMRSRPHSLDAETTASGAFTARARPPLPNAERGQRES